MYAEFFGFRELPFNNTPDPRFFCSTPDHEEALASLTYTVQERKGFVLLTGEIGAGKTLITRLMLRRFGSRIAFAHINHAVPGASDLLEAICAELEIPMEPGSTTAKVIRRLHDFLLARFAQDMPVVLVLDEAQNLPDDAFELIRTIGNLEADDAKLLQIVIVGQPELQPRFASPQLRQLRQRLFRSFHLPALDRAATEAYIRFRLDVVGAANLDLFDADAVDRVFDYSQGLPRLINTLCDNALLSAYSADRRTIDGRFLQSVVDQLLLAEPEDRQRYESHATRTPSHSHGYAASARTRTVPPPGMHPAIHDARGTYEKISRMVDTLESRMETTSPGSAGSGETRRLMDESCRAAQAVLDRAKAIQRDVAQSESRLHDVAAKCEQLLGCLRTSFTGVKNLSAGGESLKRELTALYNRLGKRLDQTRMLLTVRDLTTGGSQASATSHLDAKMLATVAKPRNRVEIAATPPGNPRERGSLDRVSTLLETSRGVAELQALVNHRRSYRPVVTVAG